MENLRPRKGKRLPKGVVLNFCSKIHGKADISVSLRLRQVKPRTGQTKSVYGRSKDRGSPGPGGRRPPLTWWVQEGFLEEGTSNLRSEGHWVMGVGGVELRESKVCSRNP